MKAALYTRVSTQEQIEGLSIANQESKLRAFCESQDWKVVDLYVDSGYSAKNTNRPQLQRLLADIDKDKFDVILVYKLDRLVRNVGDLHNLLEKMDRNKVMFKSSTEVFDTTTAAGRLFITLVAALAQWERETTVERVRDVMLKKAVDGEWSGGPVPYGYRLENKELYIVEEEAKVVREIFDMARIWGDRKVAQEINKRYKFRHKPFERHNINYIIHNPIYLGKQRYNDGQRLYMRKEQRVFEANHEAIIDEETFQAVQERRKQYAALSKRDRDSEYLYSSLLRCHRCGNAIFGHQNRGKTKYYRCEGVVKGECDLPYINEKYVTQYLLDNYETFLPKLEKSVSSGEQFDHTERLKELDKLQERYKQLYLRNFIGIEELEKEMEGIQKERQELSVPVGDDPIDYEAVYNFMESWHEMTHEEKRSFLQIVFKYIRVDAHGAKGQPKVVEVTGIG